MGGSGLLDEVSVSYGWLRVSLFLPVKLSFLVTGSYSLTSCTDTLTQLLVLFSWVFVKMHTKFRKNKIK